jgi:AraC family transcriptional activator of tynA and feaB
MEWSTKAIEADRPFGSWAEDLADAFVPLEPRKIAEQPFKGMISRADVASTSRSADAEILPSSTRRSRSRSRIAGILVFFALRCRDSCCHVLLQSGHG